MASTVVQRAAHVVLGLGLAVGLAACSDTANTAKDVAKETAKETTRQEVAKVTAPAVTGVVVQPQKVQSLAKPPAAAAKKKGSATAAGKGKSSMSTANHSKDSDTTWIEEIDLDGDGNVEETLLLWDDEDKVLFAATQDGLLCKGGTGKHKASEEDGGVLIAVFGEGNPYKRPAGSGWWVAWLDEGQCGAQLEGVYGCDFDANGKPVACGAATLDQKNDSVTIVAQRIR